MRGDLRRVRHDGGVVLERVADVAILVGSRAVAPVVELVRVVHVVVPLVAVVFPGGIGVVKVIADAGRGRGRYGERRVRRTLIGERVVAVAEPAGVVVVQQVVMAGFTTRVDAQFPQVVHDGPDAVLARVRAVAVGAATVDDGQPVR